MESILAVRNTRNNSACARAWRWANACTFAGVARVHFDHLAGLGVLQHQPAERGHFQFVAVGDLDGHDVVPAVGLAQRGEGGLSASDCGSMILFNIIAPTGWRVGLVRIETLPSGSA